MFAVKCEIFNAMFSDIFRKIFAEGKKSVVLCFYTGVSVPNDVSCSRDALLRRQLRCPDDITYKCYLEFTREFLLLLILWSQKPGISVESVFLHRYLEFMSVAITDRAQVAQNESSLQVKSS